MSTHRLFNLFAIAALLLLTAYAPQTAPTSVSTSEPVALVKALLQR